jgi:hypothetical protein
MKLTNSATGLTNSLQTIQAGDGSNSPLQMSLTAINISGSFTVNNFPITGSTSGTAGTSGSSGTSGTSGSSGTAGTSGSSGSSGTSGSNGSSGTSGINGTSGSSGTSGSNGSSGTSGTSGSSGSSGTTGSSGTSGSSGTTGATGSSGTSGTSGSDGLVGSNGTSGTSGVDGTSGSSGTSGVLDYTGLITTGSISSTQQITGSLILGNTVISGSLVGNTVNNGLIKITNEAAVSGTVQLNVTSSAPVSQSNLLFIPASPSAVVASQLTGSIVISGSNNIFFNPARTQSTGQTANGIYGYINGNNNIVTQIPLFTTASLTQRPGISNNQLNGLVSIGLITSSLASAVSNNLVYGPIVFNSQSGSVGYSNNINNSSITLNQNTQPLTGSGVPGQTFISANNFAGSIILNAVSSSIQATSNITFGSSTFVTNSFFHTGSNNFVNLQANIIGGNNNHIQFGGNPATNAARGFSTNILGGGNNIVNLDATGSAGDVFNAIIFGNNLSVNPKETITGLGVFGRWNKPVTGSTIFVVGNGTSAGDRRNAIEVTTNNQTLISGSVNISGSLLLNGVAVGGDRNGLITTGSAFGTQSMTGSLIISGGLSISGGSINSTADINGRNLNASNVSNFRDNVNITGTTSITGALLVNGVTIDGNRNGLIVTGSGGQQSITGSLNLSNALNILNSNLSILTGSLNLNNDGQSSIANQQTGRNVMYVDNVYSNFFFGNVPKGQNNRFSGDTNNFILSPTYSNFQTGSRNLIFATGNSFFNSGSNNIFIGDGQPFGNNVSDSLYIGMNENSNQSIITKRGGGSSFPIQLGFPTEITGSLNVSNLPNASGSFVVTTDSTGTLTKSPYSAVTSNLFSVGDFYSTTTQTLAAGVSGSVTYNNTGTSFGVTLASSSQLTIANAGVYSITFSAQLKGDGGQDTIYMWLKKNGTNVDNTATKLVVKNNEESVMTVEYIVQAAASDYYEIAWQNTTGDGDLAYYAVSGNIPAIPSIITSVKQVR